MRVCLRRLGVAVMVAALVAVTTSGIATGFGVGAAVALAMAFEGMQQRRRMPRAGPGDAHGELVRAHDRACSVLGALREGVILVDDAERIVYANPAARRAMRAAALEPTGRLLRDALVPEVGEHAMQAWVALREAPRSAAELPQIRYAGIACRDDVLDLTAVQVQSQRSDERLGILFLLVDATRNFELQRLKDRFLSGVSHELRTPLTSICAYAELLAGMRPGRDAEWCEFVQVIREEGARLGSLIDGMFDFLQLESGEAGFAHEAVDGAQIVQDVVAAFAPACERRRLRVDLEIAPDTPALVGDGRRLQQVVRNLLDNAVKFTPAGGRVRVVLAPREEGWQLRVEDSGPGVAPGDRTVVFEKFCQLRDHLTDRLPGTGLGLATSRAIVSRLGGLIWCEDSEFGGAAFVVLLPGVDQPRLATLGAGAGGGF